MSYDGSGTYALVAGLEANLANGQPNDGTEVYAAFADIATALSTAVTKDGQTTITANLPMAGFKLTGLGAGSVAGNSLRYEQLFTTGTVTLLGDLAIGTSNIGTAGVSLSQNDTLSWEQSATESLPSVFRMSSSGSLVMGYGIKYNSTANTVGSSYGSAVAHSAIEVGSENIKFSVNASSTVAVGSVVTLSERMRINSSGYVGIGTSAPQDVLHVYDSNAVVSQYNVILEGAQGGYGTGISFQSKLGGTGTLTEMARIVADGEGVWNGTAAEQDAGLRFFTTLNGSPSENARLTADGYLLVGYTTSNGAYKLQVNSQIFATNATVATSDRRYKKNIKPITGALDIVDALVPVSFWWEAHPVHDFDLDSEQVGFVAQDVDAALTRCSFKGSIVKSNRVRVKPGEKDRSGKAMKDGVDEEFLGLAEGKMIPILTAALKELKAEFDAYVKSHP